MWVQRNSFISPGTVLREENFDAIVETFKTYMSKRRIYDAQIKWIRDFKVVLLKSEDTLIPKSKKLDAVGVLMESTDAALFGCITHGTPNQVKAFLEEGGDPSLVAINTGNTALHIACATGSIPKVKLLLERGLSLNIRNHDNMLPKHCIPNEDLLAYLFLREVKPKFLNFWPTRGVIPNEIFARIIKNYSKIELMTNLRSVCRLWNNLIIIHLTKSVNKILTN